MSMDIKIIPKDKDTISYYLGNNLILLIHAHKNCGQKGGVIPFKSVDYYLYHVDTNVKEEILPDVKKYMVANLHFCEREVSRIYFYYLEYASYPDATFVLFSYDIESHTCREVYRIDDNIHRYEDDVKVDLYALNSNYFILQKSLLKTNIKEDYRGYLKFESFLYDNKNRIKFEIIDKKITDCGIMQMLPVAQNVCAIKLGFNLVDDNRHEKLMKKEAVEEYIGLVSISQFISDLILKLPVFSMEYIDEVFYDRTLSDIKKQGKYITYSRINTEDLSQEIVFYQFVKKETTMVVNKNAYDETRISPCVMENQPYLLRRKRKAIEFFCIRKNEVILRLPDTIHIDSLLNDFIIVTNEKTVLFKKPEKYLEIYRFPDMSRLYREKALNAECFLSGHKELIVLLEEK